MTYKTAKELYRKHAPTLFQKEYAIDYETDRGNSRTLAAALRQGMTEQEYVAVLKRAEQAEYLHALERCWLSFIIKVRARIMSGMYDKLFGQVSRKSSFDNYAQRDYKHEDLSWIFTDLDNMGEL